MKQFSILVFSLILVAGLATAATAVTVDGVLSPGEWDGYIAVDLDDSPSDYTEMDRWGAKVEGGYLYWFCELGDGQTWEDFRGLAGSKEKKTFPGLWIDADASDSTSLAYGSHANVADDPGKFEWGTNHRGIDMDLELGLIGEWVNGTMVPGSNGEGPLGEVYNYWGDDDNAGNDPVTAVSDGSWLTSGSVLEARVLVSELTDKIASVTDGVVTTDYIKVALAVQGTQRPNYPDGGTIDYGYDVGTPTAIAIDPSSKELLGGDFNLDGDVDVSDLGILATNYGAGSPKTWMEGDATRDAIVDVSDLGVLATNYGSSASASAAAVPEPTTLSLLGLGTITMLLYRRKK